MYIYIYVYIYICIYIHVHSMHVQIYIYIYIYYILYVRRRERERRVPSTRIRDKFLRCPKCVFLGRHTYLRRVSEAPEVSSFGGKTRIRDKFLRCPKNQIPEQNSHLKQFSEVPEVSSLWAKHISETSFWGAQNVKSRGNRHIREKFLRNPSCLILEQNTYLRQVSEVPKVSSLWAKHVSQTSFWGAQSVQSLSKTRIWDKFWRSPKMFSSWAKHMSETSSEVPKVFNLWAEQVTEKSSRAAQSVLV